MDQKLGVIQKDGAPVVVSIDEAKLERQVLLGKANDTEKMRWLVARMQKSMGKTVDQRLLIGALVVLTAQAICHSPREKHPLLMDAFVRGLDEAILNTYPPEVIAELRTKAIQAAEAGREAMVEAVEKSLQQAVNDVEQHDVEQTKGNETAG